MVSKRITQEPDTVTPAKAASPAALPDSPPETAPHDIIDVDAIVE